MSGAVLRALRQLPRQRLSAAELAAAGGPRRLGRSARSSVPFDQRPFELALLTRNVSWDAPMPADAELAGRGYARPLVGALTQSDVNPAGWSNTLPILWPQARDDWGQAAYVALLERGAANVLATAPVPLVPYVVLAGDQPAIAAGDLLVEGLEPQIRRPFGRAGYGTLRYAKYAAWVGRPFGVGRYGALVYSVYPAEGGVFGMALAGLGYEWAALDAACAAWQPLQLIAGGCAP